jgi:uroporphyrinogen decarboxylase
MPTYLERVGGRVPEDLFSYLKDDCRWVPGGRECYKHPEGRILWDAGTRGGKSIPLPPDLFANCDNTAEVDAFDWPNPDYLDFSAVVEKAKKYSDKAVFTGMWTDFFHIAAAFFGMENYFMKMYTEPEIVDAVTEHLVEFFAIGNEKLLSEMGDSADIFFMGNDFGTQLSLLISPELFKRFVLPGMKRNIDIAKKHGKKVMLHSCGAIKEVMPILIGAGVQAFHPLQAKALGMDAETLAREFKGKVAFMGGIDTQQLLVHGTPQDIRDDVRRVKDLLGPNLIVSPSHETLLPNVPFENVIAMSEAAMEA